MLFDVGDREHMNWLPILIGLTTTTALQRVILQCQGSTLVAPWVWCTLSAIAVALVPAVGRMPDSEAIRALVEYLVALSTFCAPMALLGAKRPQDRGWQFIVFTLWIVLALPALQPFLFAASSRFQLHEAWRGFLAVLIVIGVTNYLPTRYGIAALLVGAGQLALLMHHLPFLGGWSDWCVEYGNGRVITAQVCFLLAAIHVAIRSASPLNQTGWNRVWCDFRDSYGVVWALRVSERINQATVPDGVRLTWTGFESVEKDGPILDSLVDSEAVSELSVNPIHEPIDRRIDSNDVIQTAIRTSLRRFVDAEWIDQRLSR